MIKPPELSAALAIGWSLLITLGLVSVGVFCGLLFGGSNLGLVVGALLELALLLPTARLIGRLYGGRGPTEAQSLATAGAAAPELLLGAVLALLLQGPVGYLMVLVERRFPTPPAELKAQLVQLTPESPLLGALMFVGVALLVPYAEELFFRGALFTQLERHSPRFVTLWTTSLAFTLAHVGQPRHWPALFVLALVLGVLRRQSRSIWPGVALHAAFNAITLLHVFIKRPTEPEVPNIPWQVAAGMTALSLLGLWLFGRISARRLAGNA
jgi:membrane protease YdiL (CAAX protease family)